MIIYRNKYLPVEGFKSIFLFGVLFVRGNAIIDFVTMNHERIHSKQFIEVTITFLALLLPFTFYGLWWLWLLLSIPSFYILYVIEWFVKLFVYKFDKRRAYRNVSFEREAYNNESDLDYLQNRKIFSWTSYLFK